MRSAIGGTLDHARVRLAQGLAEDHSTGFADCRQLGQRSLPCTALLQRDHDEAVRQEGEIEVLGLARVLFLS